MFTFKQFKIDDSHCAMKVGTDGVLLGAWADLRGCSKILDLGCGCGLIALMATQRAPWAEVKGIEIDPGAAADAQSNVMASPFAERLEIMCGDAVALGLQGENYDCILSNPPFHEEDLLPPSSHRALARHTSGGGLSLEELVHTADCLLEKRNPDVRFCLILPSSILMRFQSLAAMAGFHLHRRTDVKTSLHKACKRTLIELRRFSSELIHDEILLTDSSGKRSSAYADLCSDFYL